jgi:hypothetical protein
MTKQPRDDGNDAIPVLGFRRNGGQELEILGSSVRSNAFSASTRVVSLYSTSDCKFEVGDSNVVADLSSSHFLPSGVYIDVSLGFETIASQNYKYVSVIGAAGGTLYISERE